MLSKHSEALAAILKETCAGLMRYLQLDCAILPEISKQEHTRYFLSESIALLSSQTQAQAMIHISESTSCLLGHIKSLDFSVWQDPHNEGTT